MVNEKKRSFNLFNMMVLVSISLVLSFWVAFSIINSHIENLEQDTIKYYSLLIRESLDKNLTFSKKIEQK